MMSLKVSFTVIFVFIFVGMAACQSNIKRLTKLSSELDESSALISDKTGIWSINDGPDAVLCRIDKVNGKVIKKIIFDKTTEDTEALTADQDYFYIGDFGNNHHPRKGFKILKIKKDAINTSSKQKVKAEEIDFNYEDFGSVALNKSTDFFDCEAMLSYHNHLYLFTKRRSDLKTVLYQLSKQPVQQIAKRIASFDAKGLITSASISPKGTEVVLIGYLPGHKKSFLWFLDDFKNVNFFLGKQFRVDIGHQYKNWQTEAISYISENELLFSCEQTQDVESNLYMIDKNYLILNR